MDQVLRLERIIFPRKLECTPIYEVLKKDEVHVYLSGPITYAEELQDYRRALTEGLERISPKFKIHDPWMRERLCLENPETLKSSLAEEVIWRDLQDIQSCDLVIATIFKISAGTSMEVFFASRILEKPVIIIYSPIDESLQEIPLWLYGHANIIFQSRKKMYSWLRKALEGGDETRS